MGSAKEKLGAGENRIKGKGKVILILSKVDREDSLGKWQPQSLREVRELVRWIIIGNIIGKNLLGRGTANALWQTASNIFQK